MKSTILAIAIATTALGSSSGQAQSRDFPSRSVTLIVPWPAGGTTDLAMRALASATEKHLGQPIVIENRAGAGGTIGPMQMAATAKPDGYTIAQIPVSVMRVGFLRNTTFDPTTDLTYIIGLTGYIFGVAVRQDSSWTTFQGLLAAAKEKPGQIKYGSPGVGTTPHVIMMQIAQKQSFDWSHIPFKGSSEVTQAILGGHIDAAADGSSWGPLVDSGTLRLLVTWGARRTANWPTIPTLKESGVDVVANALYGIAGPKGMDPNSAKVLHDAFKKGMEEASYIAALKQLGQEPFYLNSQDYHAFAMRQITEQKQFVKDLGLKLD